MLVGGWPLVCIAGILEVWREEGGGRGSGFSWGFKGCALVEILRRGMMNEMEIMRKGGNLMAIYLKRRPQMCNGTGEALRTLT